MLGLLLLLLSIYFYFLPHERYISILLLLAIATAGFQLAPVDLMVLPAIGISKTYDWIYVFIIIVSILVPEIIGSPKVWGTFKSIQLFTILLIVLSIYSIYIIGVETSILIRVLRNYTFFLIVFFFIPLELSDFEKVFRLLIYATSIASMLYCLQLVFHKLLLNNISSDEDFTNYGSVVARYYNLPAFVIPVVFFFFLNEEQFPLKYRHTIIGANSLAIILSQHRNLWVAVIICFFVYLIINKRLKLITAVLYLVPLYALYLLMNAVLGNRFSEGATDLTKASFSVSAIDISSYSDETISTTEFRWYHFIERFQFVIKDVWKSLFGLGLITEDSKITNALTFHIGLKDDAGNIIQVETGDITWSVIIVQTGLLGMYIYIKFYYSLLRKFISVKGDPLIQIGILYIIVLFITSFYSITILQPSTLVLLMLFASYYYKKVSLDSQS